MNETFAPEKSEEIDPLTHRRVIRWTRGPAKNQHLYFTSPSVTRSGRWLIFLSDRDGHPNLYAIHRQTGVIHRISQNAAGLLRGYVYPNGGLTGLAKASPCLDAMNERVFYIRNDAIFAVDLSGDSPASERQICKLPVSWFTAFTHISPDGKTLCVPIADPRAFDSADKSQWDQLRQVPLRMDAQQIGSEIWMIDTLTGQAKVAARAPFWVSHVQFDPAGTGRVIFNREGQFADSGIPLPHRIWCLEPDGSHRPLAPTDDGEFRTHENWAVDGSSIVYHGGRNGVPFVAARTWDGTLISEQSLAGLDIYHAIGAEDGRHLVVDKKDGCIALVDPTPGGKLVNLCRHDSSCIDQDAHVHPIMTFCGQSVVFTSDRAGGCNVYEVLLHD